jgi:DtxR family Mn-dependent transcriptional regulator
MSRAAQYLLAVYIAAHRHGSPVATGSVAELLEKTPATVTQTMQRLDDEGLVNYEAYGGTTLTAAGRERAATLHETYVTVSWFFRSVLDLDAHEAEAMELAGLVSPTVAERLVAALPYDVEDTRRRSSRTSADEG